MSHPFWVGAGRRWATSRAAVTPQCKISVWATWGADDAATPGPQRSWGPVEVEDLSSVGELRETACARLGLRRENLGQLSVAWPRSFRIQVDRQSDMARNRARMTLQAICPASAGRSLEGRNASVESNGESLGPTYEGTEARDSSRRQRRDDRRLRPWPSLTPSSPNRDPAAQQSPALQRCAILSIGGADRDHLD